MRLKNFQAFSKGKKGNFLRRLQGVGLSTVVWLSLIIVCGIGWCLFGWVHGSTLELAIGILSIVYGIIKFATLPKPSSQSGRLNDPSKAPER
jgi:hypothetical protein